MIIPSKRTTPAPVKQIEHEDVISGEYSWDRERRPNIFTQLTAPAKDFFDAIRLYMGTVVPYDTADQAIQALEFLMQEAARRVPDAAFIESGWEDFINAGRPLECCHTFFYIPEAAATAYKLAVQTMHQTALLPPALIRLAHEQEEAAIRLAHEQEQAARAAAPKPARRKPRPRTPEARPKRRTLPEAEDKDADNKTPAPDPLAEAKDKDADTTEQPEAPQTDPAPPQASTPPAPDPQQEAKAKDAGNKTPAPDPLAEAKDKDADTTEQPQAQQADPTPQQASTPPAPDPQQEAKDKDTGNKTKAQEPRKTRQRGAITQEEAAETLRISRSSFQRLIKNPPKGYPGLNDAAAFAVWATEYKNSQEYTERFTKAVTGKTQRFASDTMDKMENNNGRLMTQPQQKPKHRS